MAFKRVLWTLEEVEHDKLNKERIAEKLTWDEFLRRRTGLAAKFEESG